MRNRTPRNCESYLKSISYWFSLSVQWFVLLSVAVRIAVRFEDDKIMNCHKLIGKSKTDFKIHWFIVSDEFHSFLSLFVSFIFVQGHTGNRPLSYSCCTVTDCDLQRCSHNRWTRVKMFRKGFFFSWFYETPSTNNEQWNESMRMENVYWITAPYMWHLGDSCLTHNFVVHLINVMMTMQCSMRMSHKCLISENVLNCQKCWRIFTPIFFSATVYIQMCHEHTNETNIPQRSVLSSLTWIIKFNNMNHCTSRTHFERLQFPFCMNNLFEFSFAPAT